MKVSIQTLGSLGDVLPFISVARALRDMGANVSILAPRDYSHIIAQNDITVATPPNFTLAEWDEEAAKRGTLSNPYRFFRDWKAMIAPYVEDIFTRSFDAAKDADIILANGICAPARLAAEAYEIPFILNAHQPVISPTCEHPCAMLWRPIMGQLFNRASYNLVTASQFAMELTLRKYRQQYGLTHHPRLSQTRIHLGSPLPRVTSVSPALLSKRPKDWAENDYLMAYPSLRSPADQYIPATLLADISQEKPPIYLSFGSLDREANTDMLRTIFEGIAHAGETVIISQIMSDILPTHLTKAHIVAPPLPHDKFFPHCGGVIHHGGAGTADTALRAGIPQIIVPHHLDQFWHAHKLRKLGVAPRHLSKTKLTAEDVVIALKTLRTPALINAAKALQPRMLETNGARDLAAFIFAQEESFQQNAQ